MKTTGLTYFSFLRNSKLTRRVILALCAVFIVFAMLQWRRSKTIGGNYAPAQSFNGRDYPLFMHPHYADNQPDLETLTFKKGFLLNFSEKGEIAFHVNKFREAKNADGVTLEIYADGALIASKLENPYAVQNDLYVEDNLFQSVEMEFDIPKGTRKLEIKATANGNTDYDHLFLDKVFVTKSNRGGKAVLLVIGLFFLYLLKMEWDLIPTAEPALSADSAIKEKEEEKKE